MASLAPVVRLEDFKARRNGRIAGHEAGQTDAIPSQPGSSVDVGRRPRPPRRRPRPAVARACAGAQARGELGTHSRGQTRTTQIQREQLRPRPRPSRPEREPIRLTRRGRVVVAICVLALVCAATTVVGLVAHAVTSDPPAPSKTRSIVVEPGMTVWEIATRVASPGSDVRDLVDEIARLNGLSSAGEVEVGQRLVVPVYR